MMEVDHEAREVYCEQMRTPEESLGIMIPSEESISQRLTSPIVTTYIDTEKISFERYFEEAFITINYSILVNPHEYKIRNVLLIIKYLIKVNTAIYY